MTRLPRVLHLITRLDVGGSSENVVLCARTHAKEGFGVLVAAGPSQNPAEEASAGGFEFRVIPSLGRAIHPVRDARAFFEIRAVLKAWKPDILHTHSSKAGILGRWAAAGLGVRVIHQPHGHVFYGYFGRVKSGFYVLVERVTGWVTDTFIALSEGERRESVELGIGEPNRWVVIHSGVKLNGSAGGSGHGKSIRAKMSIPDEAVVVGTVARLEPVKGVEFLIRAARQVAEKAGDSVRFLIVGDGELMAPLRRLARELQLEEQVIFAGHQSDPAVWMEAMDIYVQPSLNEGMGKTLVMAGGLGLPIVASRVCGIPDVVLDGKSGLLVTPSEPGELADRINRLIHDPDLRSRLGTAGKQWVSSADDTGFPRFSEKAMSERLRRLYLAGILLFSASSARAVTLKVVTHFHSNFSHNGAESIESLAAQLHAKGIDVFIPTDTLIASAEYGLWPLRNLLKKRIVRRSVLALGPENYLAEIHAAQRKFPDMLIIPGTEAAAYYRWEGHPWTHLTLDDWNRHLLILGLENAEDLRTLPVIGNPPGGKWDWFLLWPAGLGLLAVCAWFLRRRGAAGLLAASCAVFLWNNYPFLDIHYDPYDDETEWPPYQQLIDYAVKRGAIAVWAHPDAGNWQTPQVVSSRVSMRTAPYPDAILRTLGHSGFGIFMEGLHQTGIPGGSWDAYLDLYLKGERERPVWAFAETDYHTGEPSKFVDSTAMIVTAKSKSAADVLAALRLGHFYAERSNGIAPLALNEWKIESGSRSARVTQTLEGTCRPKIVFELGYEDHSSHAAKVQLIRDGNVILEEQKSAPFRWEFTDTENKAERSAYRLIVKDERLTELASNPIFCDVHAAAGVSR